MSTKVLLIGIDGVRRDVLQRIAPPHLTALAARGGFRALHIDARGHTVSGPMWSTLFTGTYPAVHGVHNNATPPATRVPDVWSTLVAAGHLVAPFAATSWPPLSSRVGCGPLIDPAQVRAFTAPLVREDHEAYAVGDAQVCDAAIALLGLPETDAAFVYFGQVDEVGHHLGVGEAYETAIRTCDALVGEVLAALDARPDRAQWIVAVTTDHGHTDAGGHGGRSPAECETWVLSDSAAFVAQVTAPHELAPAIARAVTDSGALSLPR